MTRADLLTILVNQLAPLASELGQTDVTDSATGYGPSIDYALRAIGTQEVNLSTAVVDDTHRLDFIALGEYDALRRFARAAANRVDVEIDGPRAVKKRQQLFANLRLLIEDARKDLADRGFLGGSFEFGSLNEDYLEPELFW